MSKLRRKGIYGPRIKPKDWVPASAATAEALELNSSCLSYPSILSGIRTAHRTVSGTIDQPMLLLNASTVIFTTFTC